MEAIAEAKSVGAAEFGDFRRGGVEFGGDAAFGHEAKRCLHAGVGDFGETLNSSTASANAGDDFEEIIFLKERFAAVITTCGKW